MRFFSKCFLSEPTFQIPQSPVIFIGCLFIISLSATVIEGAPPRSPRSASMHRTDAPYRGTVEWPMTLELC